LRVELELELTSKILTLELLVLAHVRGKHLLDLPPFQQASKTELIGTGVVRDHSQPAHAAVSQCIDQILWNAAQTKAAAHHGDTVTDHIFESGACRAVNLGAGHVVVSGSPCSEHSDGHRGLLRQAQVPGHSLDGSSMNPGNTQVRRYRHRIVRKKNTRNLAEIINMSSGSRRERRRPRVPGRFDAGLRANVESPLGNLNMRSRLLVQQ
jgi:hypothetical protein